MGPVILQRIDQYVNQWKRKGYPGDIPDESPGELEAAGKVPSWRLVCIALIKNDKALETLGFSRLPCRAYMQIKRDELILKGKAKWTPVQRRLF